MSFAFSIRGAKTWLKFGRLATLTIAAFCGIAAAELEQAEDPAQTQAPAHAGTPGTPQPENSAPSQIEAHARGTNADAAGLSGVDPALAESTERLVSTNLHKASPTAANLASDWRFQLELARRQRRSRQFPEAKATLTRLMDSECAEELKRTALLELALGAQDENDLSRAQQIFSQFLSRWPQDFNVPEVLLRQGLVYRKMGVHRLALGKFYAVLTSALVVKNDGLDHYQKLVLQAQTEIAETHLIEGRHEEAANAFSRLLKLDSKLLNRVQIQLKLLRSLVQLGRDQEVIVVARDLLARSADGPEAPEAHYYLAGALKKRGSTVESLKQVLALLQSTNAQPAALAYWQQRAGNDLANQLYREGDYLSALDIYTALASVSTAAAWQLPILYQIGLTFERLDQPEKAAEHYDRAIAREKEVAADAPPSLRAVLDMARWRRSFLKWSSKTETTARDLKPKPVPAPTLSSSP